MQVRSQSLISKLGLEYPVAAISLKYRIHLVPVLGSSLGDLA